MKRFLTFTLATSALALITTTAFAQKAKPAPVLVMSGKTGVKGYLTAASDKKIRFKERLNSLNQIEKRLRSVTVYFYEPEEFTDALFLFNSRDYAGARPLFAECAKIYKEAEEVPGNYSTLARFYEMECARKMNDLGGLSKLMAKFIKDPLRNPDHLKQVEINEVIWEAVNKKSWARLLTVLEDAKWVDVKLPGPQRVQLSYCQGLAHEALNQPRKALNAYNKAMTGDFAASVTLVRESTLNCLRILKNHEDTKLALKLHGTEDWNDRLAGALLLEEGAALLNLWKKSLGGGRPVPGQYDFFKKFDKGAN